MEPAIPNIKKEKAYIRIVDTVIHLIAEGKVQYDDKFYTEQELMVMLGVSRPTLREALRVLEFLGVAAVSPHNGISIRHPEDEDGYLPLLYILAFEKTNNRELFELRQAMQLEMTAQAALRRDEATLQSLYEILQQMEQSITADDETFSHLDYEFHQRIIRIADNRLVLKLMNTIRPMVQQQLSAHSRGRGSSQRRETLRAHRIIADEIAAGNPEKAREAMFRHLHDSREDAERSHSSV
ncbi:MAG: FCD domain-containing protein [Clostridia bacterium]|nr:FCD domain-containing protein [Clostridia bacterium]